MQARCSRACCANAGIFNVVRPSLVSFKDGMPLSFVAAVNVVIAVAAYLKALELRVLDTTPELKALREAYEDYHECIEMNARHKK